VGREIVQSVHKVAATFAHAVGYAITTAWVLVQLGYQLVPLDILD